MVEASRGGVKWNRCLFWLMYLAVFISGFFPQEHSAVKAVPTKV